MKWLLVVFVFDISGGGMKLVTQATKVFASKTACDAEGERLGPTLKIDDPNIRSMSTCIPQSAFNERAPAPRRR